MQRTIGYLRLLPRAHSRLYTMAPSISKSAGLDVSVPHVSTVEEGAKSFDKKMFRKFLTVLGAKIPALKTGEVAGNSIIKRQILDLRGVPKIIKSQPDFRLLLLHAKESSDLPAEATQILEKYGATYVSHKIELDYDHWSADDVLHAVLPEELRAEAPSGFAIIGHIAHLNLNEEYLPYKYIIGQVILDKNPSIRTVVNKLNTIHAEFRYFDMELIAGTPNYVVSHSELGCNFQFDFREVYWNSRLQAEHERLVNQFKPEDGVIVDVMAGVGPFAVPAAKRGYAVLANDLNPACYKWHNLNAERNKVTPNLRTFCEDGRGFIAASFRYVYCDPFLPYTGTVASNRQLKQEKKLQAQKKTAGQEPTSETTSSSADRNRIGHFIMNLPDSAIEFLGAFRGVMGMGQRRLRGLYSELPMIHCYCFTRFLDPTEAEADIRKRVEEELGDELEDEVKLHLVRSVAPNKDMYCISFRLPRRVAYAVD